jgi:hypothetical protein
LQIAQARIVTLPPGSAHHRASSVQDQSVVTHEA